MPENQSLWSRAWAFLTGKAEASDRVSDTGLSEPLIGYKAKIGYPSDVARYIYDRTDHRWRFDANIYKGTWDECKGYAEALNTGEFKENDIPDFDEPNIFSALRKKTIGRIAGVTETPKHNGLTDSLKSISVERQDGRQHLWDMGMEARPQHTAQIPARPQPARSIKDKLAVAKVESAQLNAERHADRTVKTHDAR